MANYKVYGTGEKYSGRVVRVGNRYYATIGGAWTVEEADLTDGVGS